MATTAQESDVRAFAAMRPGDALQPYRFAAGEIKSSEVAIAITHCGICRSDLHLIDNDWDVSVYPFVPGHEIIGVISQMGADVTDLRIGQRVGVGWLAGSCMTCAQCLDGNENLCRRGQPTCIGRHGGFATSIRVDARFAAPLPETLPSELAAPLLCAGITVFAPLSRYRLKENSRVGVVGLGGLGHLAVQYAKAMRYAVTVFSTSADKEEAASGLGADLFIDTSRPGALAEAAGSCDLILTTVPVNLPWAEYVNALKPNGALCIVGAAPGEINIAAFPLIEGQKSIGGSAIGSNAEMRAMLRFSAEHRIAPVVELYPMKEVNHALDRLRANRVRYRAVLANET